TSGRQPGDDVIIGGDSARKTVLNDRRAEYGQLNQHARQHPNHSAIRFEPQHRCGGPGRANGDRAIVTTTSDRHAESADAEKSKSCGSADRLSHGQLADPSALKSK